jgi:hypothetical protein
MGGDRRHFNKNNKNFNRQRNQNNHNKSYNNEWQTEERLLETDVGINKFISDVEGFQGIIKAR